MEMIMDYKYRYHRPMVETGESSTKTRTPPPIIENLGSILALPLDLQELGHFLPFLREDSEQVVIARVEEPLQAPLEILTGEILSDNNASRAPPSASVAPPAIIVPVTLQQLSGETSRLPLQYLEVLFLASFLVVAAYRSRMMKRRQSEAVATKTKTDTFQEHKSRECTEITKGAFKIDDENGKYHDSMDGLGKERFQNLVDQNKFLKSVLEQQRASIEHIHQELLCRDETLIQMEKTHDQQIRDLATQVSSLSNECQQDRVERSKEQVDPEEAPEWREAIVRRLDALTDHVKAREKTAKKEQKSIGKEVIGQVRALEKRLKELEEQDQDQHGSRNVVETRQQVKTLSQQLQAVKKDLELRGMQLTKLGQYLKLRDEQETLKVGSIKSECDNLVFALGELTGQVNSQEAEASALHETINSKDEALESRLLGIHKRIQSQDELQTKGQEEVRDRCSALRQAIESITKDHKQIAANFEENRATQLVNSKEMKALELKLLSTDEQSSSTSNRMNELSVKVQTIAVGHGELEEVSRLQKEEMASRMKALLHEMQQQDERQYETQEAITRQLLQLKSDQQIFQERQELYHAQVKISSESIESLARELARAKNDNFRDDRMCRLEDRQAVLAKKVEQAVEEFQERMDFELFTQYASYDSQLSDLQGAVETLDTKQQGLSTLIQEAHDDGESQGRAVLEKVENLAGSLQGSIHHVKTELASFQSTIAKQEKDNIVAANDRRELTSQVQDLRKSEKAWGGVREQLATQIDQVACKLEALEGYVGDSADEAEKQRLELAEQVEDLSAEVDNRHESSARHESEREYETSELRSAVQRLRGQMEFQTTVQRESLGQFGSRCRTLEERLDALYSKVEGQELKQAEMLRRGSQRESRGQIQPFEVILARQEESTQSLSVEASDHLASVFQEGAQENCCVEVVCNPNVVMDEKMENESVVLATKLIAFNAELERREHAVAELEKYTKYKSDAFSSRAEVLNSEIELQRCQLKKWEETTRNNETRRKEACGRLREIGIETQRLQDELQTVNEDIADIEDSLLDDGICHGLKARLQARLHVRQERRCGLQTKIEISEKSTSVSSSECTKLAAKQELFEGELNRRQSRLCALRSSLSNVQELVVVEREALHEGLVRGREERDLWMEKTKDLFQRLQRVPGDHPYLPDVSLRFDESCKSLSQSRCNETENLHAEEAKRAVEFQDSASEENIVSEPMEAVAKLKSARSRKARTESHVRHRIEALKLVMTEAEDEQQDSITKTKEALYAKIDRSTEQHMALAQKVKQIRQDLDAQGCLEIKVDELKTELEKSGKKMSQLKDEHHKLETDLNARVGALWTTIRSLEAAQQEFNSSRLGDARDDDSHFEVLNTKIEALAENFSEHGEIVAKAGALADSIQRCEGRLQRFENEKDETKTDVSAMIDFFKSDLHALKQSLEANLNDKDAEFGGLLIRVESLAKTSHRHENQLENMETRLLNKEDKETKRSTRIQPEHILQQMSEKYIDVAAKVDVLANEFIANEERDLGRARRIKDRDALYLSQMDAVRRDFETQQARYQDEMQMKVYHTMLNVFNAMAKKQERSSTFPTWSPGEARRLDGADGNRGDGRRRRGGEEEDENQMMVREGRSSRQSSFQGSRGGIGYTMASGILSNNLFVPVMMSSSHRGESDSGEDSTH